MSVFLVFQFSSTPVTDRTKKEAAPYPSDTYAALPRASNSTTVILVGLPGLVDAVGGSRWSPDGALMEPCLGTVEAWSRIWWKGSL